MVSMLGRMLWRDLWHLRGQLVAAALVVACGIAVLVAIRGTYQSLLLAQTDYYQTHRFADVFAHLRRAPDSLAEQMRQWPGVAQVQTRLADFRAHLETRIYSSLAQLRGLSANLVLREALTPEEFAGYCRGNALKYLSRAGHKDATAQEVGKAIWYLERWRDSLVRTDTPTPSCAAQSAPPSPAGRSGYRSEWDLSAGSKS